MAPIPKNIYGVTKTAAEDLFILRTSRFFPEVDDVAERRDAFDDANLR